MLNLLAYAGLPFVNKSRRSGIEFDWCESFGFV